VISGSPESPDPGQGGGALHHTRKRGDNSHHQIPCFHESCVDIPKPPTHVYSASNSHMNYNLVKTIMTLTCVNSMFLASAPGGRQALSWRTAFLVGGNVVLQALEEIHIAHDAHIAADPCLHVLADAVVGTRRVWRVGKAGPLRGCHAVEYGHGRGASTSRQAKAIALVDVARTPWTTKPASMAAALACSATAQSRSGAVCTVMTTLPGALEPFRSRTGGTSDLNSGTK
jgi:hypothetical protein